MIVKNLPPPPPSKSGQAIAEYLILVALIAVGSIGVVRLIQENVDKNLANVANSLAGHSSTLKGSRAEESLYKRRDLGDFHETAKGQE